MTSQQIADDLDEKTRIIKENALCYNPFFHNFIQGPCWFAAERDNARTDVPHDTALLGVAASLRDYLYVQSPNLRKGLGKRERD